MKNKYIFILTITFLCSLLLSLASQGLKSKALNNIELDKKKNILSAIGLNINELKVEDINNYFFVNIDTLILSTMGDIVDNLSIDELKTIENNQTFILDGSFTWSGDLLLNDINRNHSFFQTGSSFNQNGYFINY